MKFQTCTLNHWKFGPDPTTLAGQKIYTKKITMCGSSTTAFAFQQKVKMSNLMTMKQPTRIVIVYGRHHLDVTLLSINHFAKLIAQVKYVILEIMIARDYFSR